jgi:membrane protein implicated in regulation of membrane protease activity
MSDLRKSDQPPPDKRPLPVGPAVAAGILLLIPVVVLLIVPLYAKESPTLLGFPFFYWFQLLMVIVASVLTYAAYTIVQRARRGRGGRR